MTADRYAFVEFDTLSLSRMTRVKAGGEALLGAIGLLAESRERSLALTKLDEAMMWAARAIRESQLKREASKGGTE